MKERKFTVKNSAGIHCRPSSVILNAIHQDFPGNTFTLMSEEGQEINLNSILNLISMGLAKGHSAILRAEGPNEIEAIKKIGDLFEFEFDFPPKS